MRWVWDCACALSQQLIPCGRRAPGRWRRLLLAQLQGARSSVQERAPSFCCGVLERSAPSTLGA